MKLFNLIKNKKQRAQKRERLLEEILKNLRQINEKLDALQSPSKEISSPKYPEKKHKGKYHHGRPKLQEPLDDETIRRIDRHYKSKFNE